MFFEYNQNNSGGDFVVDKNVCAYVIIEADSCQAANEKAETLGLYFDGSGDCQCCGNRWHEADDYDEIDLSEYDNDVVKYVTEYRADAWTKWTTPYIRIHFKDGTRKEF